MKLTLTPALAVLICVLAGCTTSTAETTGTAHLTPAPAVSLVRSPSGAVLTLPFGTVLTLPVVRSSPAGKGVAWSVGRHKKTDSSVTLDWSDTPLAECGRAYEVRLGETHDSVTIQLVPGKRKDIVCSADAENFTMIVPLSAPIGSRSILES